MIARCAAQRSCFVHTKRTIPTYRGEALPLVLPSLWTVVSKHYRVTHIPICDGIMITDHLLMRTRGISTRGGCMSLEMHLQPREYGPALLRYGALDSNYIHGGTDLDSQGLRLRTRAVVSVVRSTRWGQRRHSVVAIYASDH